MAQHKERDYMLARIREEREAIESVKQKLESGEYPMRETRCFCGANNDRELKTHDRLGIPHRVVVCLSCGIARANPCMSWLGYHNFYNNEYRKFIYRFLDEPPTHPDHETELIRQKEYKTGEWILQKVIDEDLAMPKVVVDIGCYEGGVLDRFKELGAETHGVEFNVDARINCSSRGHNVYASMDELPDIKPDLIIMQDVVEHYLDLNELSKVRDMMSDSTYLWVFTPGMFRTDPRNYWQIAHTWYFVANTFQYVMDELGFQPTYIDEDIGAFFQRRYEPLVEVPTPPAEWAEYIIDEAEGKEERRLPPFRGTCKFTKKLLYGNMRRNYALKLPDVAEIVGTRSGPIAIVGGGPSADEQLTELHRLQLLGTPVIAIARMYPWCLKNGITPDYVVSLDCSEEQERGFEYPSLKTTHLMSAVTRPEIVEKLVALHAPCYIFDSRDDRKIKNLRRDAGYEQCVVINSGGSVVITCMATALTLGFDEFHIFGFDCMFPNREQTHAKGIAGESVEQRVEEVEIAGEWVLTTPSFIEFTNQALDLFSRSHEFGMLKAVNVYGDSLLKRMWPTLRWVDAMEAA
jgi:hypothetical protein